MMDIFDGIAHLRTSFLSQNLKSPCSIMLESHEEGMRFLSYLRCNNNFSFTLGSPDLGFPVVEEDASIWMEVKIMGISVRWPSKKYALPDGTFIHS